jgi:hypothetical protein
MDEVSPSYFIGEAWLGIASSEDTDTGAIRTKENSRIETMIRQAILFN